jgi:hypothetical protein
MKLSAAAIVAACGTAALALLPLAVPPYYTGLMIPFYGYAIALLGFNLLFGYTGLLSFGHAMFLGVGAYGAAILSGVLGVKSFELVLLTVMFASCAIALPVGALCVRYTGIFFGMLTLAFGMLFLSLPKSRFVRIDGVARQGSDTQQCLRTSRSDVCRACPFQARREFAPHYNRSHISQEFAKGGAGSVHRILRFT